MMYLLLLCLLSVISAADAVAPCEDRWHYYQGGNKCIKPEKTNRVSWRDAQAACQKEGGRLLTIPDAKTQTFINELLTETTPRTWIGLSDINTEGVFKWSDGTSLCGFQNWAGAEPNNVRHGNLDEDCVHQSGGRYNFWYDQACVNHYPYVCERKGPGCDWLNGGCSDICTAATDGSWAVKCSCHEGYASYKGECYDVDECSKNNGGCDYSCQNKRGSYECGCPIDYIYNGTKCVLDEDDSLIG